MIRTLRSRATLPSAAGWVAAGLFAICLGAISTAKPRGATEIATLGIGTLVVAALRSLPTHRRAILAGVFLGTGDLASSILGASVAVLLLPIVLLAALPPLRRGHVATKAALCFGGALLAASAVLTGQATHATTSVIVGLFCAVVASCWCLSQPPSDSNEPAPGLLLLQTVGLVGGAFMVLAYLAGHSFVSVSANEAAEAVVTASNATRANGVWYGSNLGAIVLSAAALATLMAIAATPAHHRLTPFPLLSLALSVFGLILTGSRASILATVLGGAFLGLTLIRRRVGTGAVLAGGAGIFVVVALQLGTFAGRSLNLLSSNDPSSLGRRTEQTYLFSRIDWFQLHGYGFTTGASLAPNPVSGTFLTIDEAWLYTCLCLGGVAVAGFVILLATQALRTASVNIMFVGAAVIWLILTTVSEDYFLSPEQCVCGMLLFGSAAAYIPQTVVPRGASRPPVA